MTTRTHLLLSVLIVFCATAIPAVASIDTIPPLIERTLRNTCGDTVEAVVTDMPEPPIRSNLSTIDLLVPESFNVRIDVEPFEEGVAPVARYSVAVVDRTKDARAIVRIYDKAGNASYDTVSFTAVDVVAEPRLLSFGNSFPGTRLTKKITLENRSFRRVRIVAIRLQNGDAGFGVVEPTASFELDSARLPGARRDLFIQFDATVAGTHVDTLRLEDECGSRYSIVVVASVGAPIIEVTDHDFGAWPISAPASVDEIEIRNTSLDGGVLTVTGVARDFSDRISFSLPDGLPAFPFALTAGESRVLRVAFAPGAVKTYIDSIVFDHNAPSNQRNDPTALLRGTGHELPNAAPVERRAGAAGAVITAIAPNPATDDAITLRFRASGPATIRLVSLNGERRREWCLAAGATSARLDLFGIAPGTYFVSLIAGGVADVCRLVVAP